MAPLRLLARARQFALGLDPAPQHLAGFGRTREQASDAGDELLGGERLRHVIVGAAGEPLEPRLGLGGRRDQDDRHVGIVRILAQQLAHFETALLGKPYVEHHQVVPLAERHA